MKLKELLKVVYFENEVKFFIMKADSDANESFVTRIDANILDKYEDYFVTLVDIDDRTIVLADFDWYE